MVHVTNQHVIYHAARKYTVQWTLFSPASLASQDGTTRDPENAVISSTFLNSKIMYCAVQSWLSYLVTIINFQTSGLFFLSFNQAWSQSLCKITALSESVQRFDQAFIRQSQSTHCASWVVWSWLSGNLEIRNLFTSKTNKRLVQMWQGVWKNLKIYKHCWILPDIFQNVLWCHTCVCLSWSCFTIKR